MRSIITKVNGAIRRLFSKARREHLAEDDVSEGGKKQLEDVLVVLSEEPDSQRTQSVFTSHNIWDAS